MKSVVVFSSKEQSSFAARLKAKLISCGGSEFTIKENLYFKYLVDLYHQLTSPNALYDLIAYVEQNFPRRSRGVFQRASAHVF